MFFKKLEPKDRHARCLYCNYVGCEGKTLYNHVKFITWLFWNKNNPKRVYKRLKHRLTDFDYSQIENLEFDGIDHRDMPDYCDAYISYAEYKGKPMSEKQLDRLNDNSSFVYDSLMEYLH